MSVVTMKGSREAPRAVRSAMETLIFTADQISQWVLPPFQRPLRVNEKVRALAEELKQNGGVISGVLTLGKISNDRLFYIVDGQHRIEAFKITGLKECIADVRICTFDSLAEMAEEFVNLNTALVRMRPDDVLRGLEGTVKVLQRIRQCCPYVGYDQVRRGTSGSPVVSMSALLRCWIGSHGETPTANVTGKTAARLATELDEFEEKWLIRFLGHARAAWGGDSEYYRLWGVLNLTMSMWLWRKLVVETDRSTKRYIFINQDQFRRCLMSVSASRDYLDWLPGRLLSDRDRSPCYARLKVIFAARLREELGEKKVQMPGPAWSQ